jgi:pyrimidine operon attenuation protein/uracil phosphoribosyltransferase
LKRRENLKEKKVLLNALEMEKVINRLVFEIIEKLGNKENVAIVGIRTRGVFLAKRIWQKIKEEENVELNKGTIDIALYRDDFFQGLSSPQIGPSELNFNVENANILLVDDVLYSGRTVRAGIDAILDYGRPKTIKFVTLIDRGGRELPIQPDFIGKKVEVGDDEVVAVFFKEIDKEDKVVLV